MVGVQKLGKPRRKLEWIKYHIRDMLVVGVLAFALSLILIRAYWIYWLNEPYWDQWKGPSLNTVDIVLLLGTCAAAAVFLADVLKVVYGYVISILLAIVTSTVFSFYHIWIIEGQSEIFGLIPWGWEVVLFYAFVDIMTMMVPVGAVFSFTGALLGGLLNSLVRP